MLADSEASLEPGCCRRDPLRSAEVSQHISNMWWNPRNAAACGPAPAQADLTGESLGRGSALIHLWAEPLIMSLLC